MLRVTGNADLVSLIKGGVVDYAAEGLTGRQYDALAAAGFPVLHGETPSIMRLHMAMDKEPFTDARVRQAMLYAIPHDRIIKTALAGRGKRQVCLFNAEDWTCNNSYEKYKLDPAKAKALLKEAGKEKFSFDFWYSTALPYNSDIAIIIADSLKSIGVTANLKPTPALQLLDAVPGAHQRRRPEHERHVPQRVRDLAERSLDAGQSRGGDQDAAGRHQQLGALQRS